MVDQGRSLNGSTSSLSEHNGSIPVSPSSEHDYSDSASYAENACKEQSIKSKRSSSTGLAVFSKDAWGFELLQVALACLAWGLLIFILVHYQERPQPRWPSMISINSVIAILTAIQKAAMLVPVSEAMSQLKWQHFEEPHHLIALNQFDAASRGPWGSLCLISANPRKWLTTLGAILTIGALAVDPFSQQIIRYSPCLSPLPDQIATIPRVNSFTHDGLAKFRLKTAREESPYATVFNPLSNDSAATPIHCPTGECHFPDDSGAKYSSLGICYFYKDLTNSVQENPNRSTNSFADWYIASLPSDFDKNYYNGPLSLIEPALLTTRFHGVQVESLVFDVLMMAYTNCSAKIAQCTRSSLKPFAFRSQFAPCVKTYTSEISRSKFEERVIATEWMLTDGRGGYDHITSQTLRNGKWHTCKKSTSPLSDLDSRPYYDENGQPWYVESDCHWYADDSVVKFLVSFLRAAFGGGQYKREFLPVTNDTVDGEPYSSGWNGPYDFQSPLHLYVLGQNGMANNNTVIQYMNNVADYLTAVIREYGASNDSGYARGDVLHVQTCIHIRWGWLAAPSTLLILTIGWFGTVIIYLSYSTSMPLWKSSQLVLLHHVHGNNQLLRDHGIIDSKEALEKMAKKTRASFLKVDGEWKLQMHRGDDDRKGRSENGVRQP